eukprot:CAMPEP_0117649402 /NCGR_PEP_ID=MMETSP0804-20121206/952_1 /TAXON_ID=1074897 /ORGANISM="Tetraselmis astigmatica, Strain CCMP880" /LENGTH=301 /DNA_ID=CAMNT_0005455135 /DNA_START=57 /DNA_END=962 /DNA_ORIENTATION=+
MPPSAYFAFCDAHRAEAQKQLSDARGAKVSGAEVAKELGSRWQKLGDEEKQKYKEAAQAKADEKEAQGKADPKPKPAEGQTKKKRGPTAYFIFMEEHRAALQQELKATAGDKTETIGVAAVAKALGERWRNLSAEDKEKYSNAACEKTKELQEAAAAAGKENTECMPAETASVPSLPLGTVKRIMSFDDDFTRVTGDGLKHVALAADLFVTLLAQKAAKQAARQKKRTVRFTDVLSASRAEKRLRPITELLAMDPGFAGQRGEVGDAGRSDKEADKEGELALQKGQKEDASSRRITDFFRS